MFVETHSSVVCAPVLRLIDDQSELLHRFLVGLFTEWLRFRPARVGRAASIQSNTI